jgi:hypothetical protein
MDLKAKILATCASLLIATPSFAHLSYVGNFKGVVTSGSYELVSYFEGILENVDLTGDLVDVSFTASFFDSFDDFGNPVTALDVQSSVVDLTNPYSNTFDAMTYSQDFSTAQSATFVGNGASASTTADWRDLFFGTTKHFDLTYSGASAKSGPVTGSGSTLFNDYPLIPETTLVISFNLTSGSVAVLGAPEPSTWALMIGGFGIIGAALRRRHAKIAISFA